MRETHWFVGLTVLAVGLVLGCGASTPPEVEPAPPAETAPPIEPAPTAEPPSTAAPEAAADAGPPEPAKPLWKDMNGAQRAEYMKTVVAPKMGQLFKEFDPKHFADVTCVTCHGPNAKKGEFKMPNPKLPKVASFEAAMKKNPKTTKFMAEQVVPEMSKLLDVPPFDPATKAGFGCMNCHTAK
jgi:hypothetical protein